MRRKRFIWNTTSSLGSQVISIICGFLLPRVILNVYGSGINGLVSSITQFLGIITFLEFGVGAVVQSSLYRPLAEHDEKETSRIIRSGNRFFRKIAMIMLGYVTGLIIFFPLVVNDYGFVYTAFLIISMSISSFVQYYFGITNQILLIADQKGYIVYILQSVTILANTVVCFMLISYGANIQIVKLATSAIYIVKPVCLYVIIKKIYPIDRKIQYKVEPIKQKWCGMAQHIAAVVLENTDTIVLTLFSTLQNVSVYTVYYLVIHSIKQIFLSLTQGIQSLIGEMWTRKEIPQLKETFSWMEWVIHSGVVLLFGCTGVLIVPFVKVYTLGVHDADYIVPLFAFLITFAHAWHCLRLPYNIMILAAGHYKQTQKGSIAAAVINIAVSVAAVKLFGLIGVAVGTLAAMFFQTIWWIFYLSRNILELKIFHTVKLLLVDGLIVFVASICSNLFLLKQTSYMGWILLSVNIGFVWIGVFLLFNFIFYRSRLNTIFLLLKRKVFKL